VENLAREGLVLLNQRRKFGGIRIRIACEHENLMGHHGQQRQVQVVLRQLTGDERMKVFPLFLFKGDGR